MTRKSKLSDQINLTIPVVNTAGIFIFQYLNGAKPGNTMKFFRE